MKHACEGDRFYCRECGEMWCEECTCECFRCECRCGESDLAGQIAMLRDELTKGFRSIADACDRIGRSSQPQ